MRNKILTALLSVVIAFGLWMYVIRVVSPNSESTYYNIPVGVQGESVLEERDLMVTTTDLPTVNLRLSGNRTDLDKLNSSNITVVADVSKIYSPGEHKLGFDVSYPSDIPNNAISIQKRTPDSVVLTVEERAYKTVKVSVKYVGAQEEGYSVDKENIALSETEFQITGPERILNQVASAEVTVNLDGRNESIAGMDVPYTLLDAIGRPVTNPLIEDKLSKAGVVTIESLRIVKVKQIELDVEIAPGGGATKDNSEIEITPKTITVSGSDSLLDSLGEKLLLGTVELGKLLADSELPYTIVLPEGVTNESGEGTAKVSVRFPNLRTKSLSITDITAENVPKDMEAELITKVLEIRFRGPKALIDTLGTSDVKAVVDFAGGKAGTETKQVTITLSDDYADVGAVGSYTVSATLRQKKQ